MTTIIDMIRSILPQGTNPRSTGWDNVCRWPPDLFAVAATIAERTGFYSGRPFTCYWDDDFMFDDAYVDEIQEAGTAWARDGEPAGSVGDLWSQLVQDFGNHPIGDTSAASLGWQRIVIKLLAVADEACANVGFPPLGAGFEQDAGHVYTPKIPYLVYVEFKNYVERNASPKTAVAGSRLVPVLPYLPNSLCIMVPTSSACVQPKTNTPSIGCTLRSLSHHLALLPSTGAVATHWVMSHDKYDPSAVDYNPIEHCNLLLVPFPYVLNGRCFQPTERDAFVKSRSFKLRPEWIGDVQPEVFADFLVGLTKECDREGATVHGIVLPETALPKTFAISLASCLARILPELELLITGTISDDEDGSRNNAAMFRLAQGVITQEVFQSKHHRWCLEQDQIRRYNLGQALDPHFRWWEEIEVSDRRCYVTLFREGATLSVLVCEDLARYDPVLPAMNSIGPNLVIALLMDGPQLQHRWPGRYATVLADDPGSAVLTLTCLGMVSRSAMPGDQKRREVALWKGSDGKMAEIKLPEKDHAVLLTLTSSKVEQFTNDGRGDDSQAVKYELGAVTGIRHPNPPEMPGLQLT